MRKPYLKKDTPFVITIKKNGLFYFLTIFRYRENIVKIAIQNFFFLGAKKLFRLLGISPIAKVLLYVYYDDYGPLSSVQ